jgi:glycosyltransferase involved in cell wall biosynthesis
MITLIVPTRNRAHTIRRVASSYFSQASVSEIIFVSDAGDDDSECAVMEIAKQFPATKLIFLRNSSRWGASKSRNIGVSHSTNEYILFVDDDEYLQDGYAVRCVEKLIEYRAGAVSGRRIYMLPGETRCDALGRFGTGLRSSPRFRWLICEYVNGAKFAGDAEQPITNAIILTTRTLLRKYPFDDYYAKGNGYREETDFQMNLFTNGHKIIVTNDVHSFHLPLSEVRTGGQRAAPLWRIYWSILYTRYFYGKYYYNYAARVGLNCPKHAALFLFAVFSIYRELLRPLVYPYALKLKDIANRLQNRLAASRIYTN